MKIPDISDNLVNQVVEVVGKVCEVKDVQTVKKNEEKELVKQDVLIGDETKSCRLVLWQEDVISVEEGKCYKFAGLGVQQFSGVKYLTNTTDSTKVELIEEFEKVNEKCLGEEEEESGRSVKGEIVSVILVSEYLSCKFCRCKATVEYR